MKAPKNFYNTVDQRKLGLEDGLLPDVTAADNGKVLKVTGGKWQPGDDGGAQTMTVEITYDSEQEEYSADKTHAEIIAAIAAGVIVTATYNNRTFVYAGKNQPSAFDAVYFSYLQADSDDQFIGKIFEIDEDERITYSEHDLNNENVLPAVTSEDAGKGLIVDENGNWTKDVVVPYSDRFYTIPVVDKDGKIYPMIPLINVGINRTTIDINGYYETDMGFAAPDTRVGGHATSEITPADFDNFIIGLGTQIFAGLNINDGTNNINLRGCGSWNMQSFDSTNNYMGNIASLLEYITYTNYLVDSDKYAMYDCTITRVDDKYHIKFKLAKITTT